MEICKNLLPTQGKKRLLSELGASSREIDELAHIINSKKDTAVKLTGAGGGVVIGFCLPEAGQRFEDLLSELGCEKIPSPLAKNFYMGIKSKLF